MAIELYSKNFYQLSDERIDKWKTIPTAVIGDS